MSDEIQGYAEAADVLETRQERFEEAQQLADELPDGFRVAEVSAGEGYHIERQTQYAPKWVPVAEFRDIDAAYEWADDIQKNTSSEYRCVIDQTNGGVYLEVRVDE
jgi:hypothetical protein